jgi:hypothetical protein
MTSFSARPPQVDKQPPDFHSWRFVVKQSLKCVYNKIGIPRAITRGCSAPGCASPLRLRGDGFPIGIQLKEAYDVNYITKQQNDVNLSHLRRCPSSVEVGIIYSVLI